MTLPDIFQGTYGQPVGIAGLHYLALGAGLSVASQVRQAKSSHLNNLTCYLSLQTNAALIDRFYKRMKEKNGGIGKPEFRLGLCFLSVTLEMLLII